MKNNTFRTLFLCLLLTLLMQGKIFALDFEVVDLGTLETDYSQAVCINDKNQVCGTYTFQGEKHFFLWSPEIGTSCLELPTNACPISMNNLGQITGNYTVDNTAHGFVWDAITGFIDIGTLGGKATWVTDINDLGQVIGSSETSKDPNFEQHAFLWENGVMQDLGTLCGDLCLHGNTSCALSINNEGVIVGYSNHAVIHKGKKLLSANQAVIWENGKIRQFEIQDTEFCHSNKACAINNSTHILYVQEDMGSCFIRDLKTGHDFRLCHLRLDNVKMNDNCDVLGSNMVWIHEQQHKSSFQSIQPIVKNTIWKHIVGYNDINNTRWIVGLGTTIYGEQHAVLLRPKQ